MENDNETLHIENLPNNKGTEAETSLIEIIYILLKHKLILILIPFMSVSTSLIFVIYMQPEFESIATFVPINPQGNKLGLGNLSGIAAIAGVDFSGGNEEMFIDYVVLMESRSFTAKIINKLNIIPILFKERYDPITGEIKIKELSNLQRLVKAVLGRFKSETATSNRSIDSTDKKVFLMEKAIKIMRSKHVQVRENDKNLYSVKVYWEDRWMASKIANAYLETLEEYLSENEISASKRSRKFIENQLANAEIKLRATEEDLKIFGEKKGVIDAKESASIIASTISAIKQEAVIEEVKLKVAKQIHGIDSSEVWVSKTRLKALKEQLSNIELGNSRSSNDLTSKHFNISLNDIPQIALDLGRLSQELQIQQEIYKLLRTRYETAKIDEVKESQTIMVVDFATPSEKPTKPNKLLIMQVTGIISLIVTSILILFLEFFKRSREEFKTVNKN